MANGVAAMAFGELVAPVSEAITKAAEDISKTETDNPCLTPGPGQRQTRCARAAPV
jgi:hypothetical protein